MKQCRVILAALTIVSLLLAACGGTPTPTGGARFVWWHTMTGSAGDAINQLTARYNASQSKCMAEAVLRASDEDELAQAAEERSQETCLPCC